MDHEHEEVEQIPWTMLAEQLGEGRRRSLGMISLAIIAALVAGFVAVNVLRRPTGTIIALDPATPETDVAAQDPTTTLAADDSGEVARAGNPGTSVAPLQPPPPALYSEADLMAVLPVADEQLAAARAEWFVADFFTVLGPDDPVAGLAMSAPHPVADDGGYSWVEWVRAASIDQVDAGRFDVSVLFRTLRRGDDGGLVRMAVRAVVVGVVVDAHGRAGIAGLPAPAPVPAAADVDSPQELTAPPDEAAAVAIAEAAAFGADPKVEGATATAEGWNVIVSVVDQTNVRWPMGIDVLTASGPES